MGRVLAEVFEEVPAEEVNPDQGYLSNRIRPQGVAEKCTFCLHRVQRGQLPACVEVCPTACLHFGDLNDPASNVSRLLRTREWKVNNPETGCDPHVFFLT